GEGWRGGGGGRGRRQGSGGANVLDFPGMTAVSRKLLRRRDRDHRHFVWIGVCFGWESETDAVEHALDLVADELALSDEGLRGRVNGLAVHVHEPPVVDVGGSTH